ncbi:BREX system serine/threonine kinase PglW [Pirellulaceae bacterium SH501]
MDAPRWNIVTPSQYEWERRALDFIRVGLPNHDPYRAWANFEFQSPDGAIYEVDLLVLTKQGFWLVEIKSWSGIVRGDAGTWTRTYKKDTVSEDNPVLLANRKAKALVSLLKSQQASKNIKMPWLEAVVFLSADDLHCELSGPALNRVLLRDRPGTAATPEQKGTPERKGILQALLSRVGPGIEPECRSQIDSKVARAIGKAIDDAGIRPSQRSRRVGDYVLGELLADGPGYQDRLAKHVQLPNDIRRVRMYSVAQADSEEDRQRLKRAAIREYEIIQSLNHPNILQVTEYKEHEFGPALLFRYLDPQAIRFDHYLATQGHKLTTEHRLKLLRQIADAIRYAHRKRVVHRALSPQSILVMKDEGGRAKLEQDLPSATMVLSESSSPFDDPSKLYLQVFNWQVGVRETTTTSGRVTNVEDLVESQSLVYMSPEAVADQRKVTESSDVFSLGAIAYHLFTNRPPASGPSDLARILREQKGLLVSSVLDGAGPKLEELIQWSTHPDVLTRIGSVEDFLTLLADVEEELTSPAESVVNDPLLANQGDKLPHGYVVKRELGQGATAKALLVTKDDKESVLKIALTEEDNTRLLEEAEALQSIHSEFIVSIEQVLTMHGRTVLVLQKAGDQTLAAMLHKEGVPSLDLLSRYGDDLLSALCSLERHGVVHRDIKPDNIGIRSLTKQRNQLILFDFSLARASLDNIAVGTEGYKDPFLKLRKPPRWDLSAERYSAAVTLYEMTLGRDVLPQWGSDKSDPALTNDKLVINAENFHPSVRDGLVEFYERALNREPAKRFDNAYDMQTAWRRVFTDAENRKITTTTGEEVVIGVSVEQATLSTPVSALGLSNRARNALERADVLTVRDLLNFPIGEIHLMKGVGYQTRREIIAFVGQLREQFPNVEPVPRKDQPGNEDVDGPPSLEALHHRVMGARNPKKEAEWNIRRVLLGEATSTVQTPVPGLSSPTFFWPSQTSVAEALSCHQVNVHQVLKADRTRWSKDSCITTFRHELCEQLQRLGGVVTISEMIDLAILLRPAASTIDSATQQRLASAVARAAVETEDMMAQRRFQMRRVAGKIVIACSQELAVFAEKLGQAADKLAIADPLASPMRVFQELYEVRQPPQPHGCQPFNNERLLNLAAAMSQNAAVSSRQEVYPRGMDPERALRLGLGTLSGLGMGETEKGFCVEQIRERVRSRYPSATILPDRPELDDLLRKVGIDVRWNPETKLYQRREIAILHTSGSSMPRRLSTATSTRHVEVTPDVAEARAFEERLKHAHKDGGFLVLTVRPSRMRAAESELVRRFGLQRVSFDELLFELLVAEAKELEVDWSVISDADGADHSSQDWKNLLHLVGRVAPKIVSKLLELSRHILLVNPGMIARYDLMSILETLRDKVGAESECPGMWVLVASDGQNELPILDSAEIPLITPGQRARVSESWIDNLHRGRVVHEQLKVANPKVNNS